MKNLAIVFLIIFTLFGCKNNKQKKGQIENKPLKVKVGYLNMVSSLTHFVAIEKGFYKEQNLEVVGNPVKTSNLIAQELVSGHIDIGIELAITPILKQLEKSPNTVKIFSTSNITTENGFDAILVKNSSNINSLEDLSGKKVGGFPGSTAKVSLLQLFRTKFPKLTQPTFIQLTPNLHIQSLETGDIDALFAYEPVLSTGKVKHSFKQIFPSVYGTQFTPNPIGVGAVNQKWLEGNSEIAKLFFKAIDKSLDFINNNPKEAKTILAKATKIDENIAQNMNLMPLSKSNEIDITNLDKYLLLLQQLKEITELPAASEICIQQN